MKVFILILCITTVFASSYFIDAHSQSTRMPCGDFPKRGIYIPYSATLENWHTTRQFTIICNVFVSKFRYNKLFSQISEDGRGFGASYGFDISISLKNQICFIFKGKHSPKDFYEVTESLLSKDNAINEGECYQIGCTLDLIGRKMNIYINGQLSSSKQMDSNIEPFSLKNEPTLIGYNGVAAFCFDGSISEVKFYNRCLSNEEILQGINSSTYIQNGLIAYWPLSKDASDLSSNKQDGHIEIEPLPIAPQVLTAKEKRQIAKEELLNTKKNAVESTSLVTYFKQQGENTPIESTPNVQRLLKLGYDNPETFDGITFTIFLIPSRNLNTEMPITEDDDSWISYQWDRKMTVGIGEEFVITTPYSSNFNGNQIVKAKLRLIGTIGNRCHFEVLSLHKFN